VESVRSSIFVWHPTITQCLSHWIVLRTCLDINGTSTEYKVKLRECVMM
jgi:hypothetical protein